MPDITGLTAPAVRAISHASMWTHGLLSGLTSILGWLLNYASNNSGLLSGLSYDRAVFYPTFREHNPSTLPPPVSPSVKSPIRFIISLSANPFILIHAMTRNRWLGNVGWKIPICNPPPGRELWVPLERQKVHFEGWKIPICTPRSWVLSERHKVQGGLTKSVSWPDPPHLFLDKSDTADASSAVQRFAWDVLWSGYLTSEQCSFWRKLTGGVEFFWNWGGVKELTGGGSKIF